MTSDCITAAQHYGWPLIKLSKPSDTGPSPGKKPIHRNWETMPSLTPEEAEAWFAEDGNIGIRTGNGLIVVDCDGDRPDGLPATPTVQTGSGDGQHLYYSVTPGTVFRVGNTARWIHPSTDTRGEGGQVVAPGSIHAVTGALYEWMPGLSPADIALAPLPQWVIDAINNPDPPPWRQKNNTTAPRRTYAVAIPPGLHPFIAGNIQRAYDNVIAAPSGVGNEVLNTEAFGLGGWLDLSDDYIMNLLLPAAMSGGRRSESESRKTITSGIQGGREKPRSVPISPAAASAVQEIAAALNTTAAVQPGTEATLIPSPTPRDIAEKYLGLAPGAGTASAACGLRYWRGDWYRYTGTHYARYTAESLHRDLSAALSAWHYFTANNAGQPTPKPLRNQIKDSLLRDVTSQIRGMVMVPEEREAPCWLDGSTRSARDWIALQNGLFSLSTRETMPHTPLLFNTFALPFNHQPDADSPETWISFITNTWPGEPGVDCALMLAEWFGYCLSRDMSHHKMLWIIGPTRSGKGVISRILAALLGPENACYPTLGSLGDKNGGQVLIGKRLAIIGDARLDKRRTDKASIIERLLSISGGDEQTFARKYLADWTGTPECKFVMLSNELPPLADESGALLGRLLFLQTIESHLGREDRFLESKIRRELPAIFNWALDGLERLNAQGRFTAPESSREIIASFRAISAPLTAFVEDCCVVDETASIECGALYARYTAWAEEEGMSHPYSKNVFGQKLKSVVPGLKRERVAAYESRAYYYHGIKMG